MSFLGVDALISLLLVKSIFPSPLFVIFQFHCVPDPAKDFAFAIPEI